MKSSAVKYANEVHSQLQMYATWLPDITLKVGDVGTVDNNVFVRTGTLGRYRVKYKIVPDATARSEYEFSSDDCTELRVDASADGVPTQIGTVNAATKISFKKKNSVFVSLQQCMGFAIDDLADLGTQLLNRVSAGTWSLDLYVVTRLVEAGAATIVQSSSAQADITLEAANKTTPVSELFKVQGALAIKSSKAIGFRCVAKEKTTPLIRLGKVKRGALNRIFGQPGAFVPATLRMGKLNLSALQKAIDATDGVDLARESAGMRKLARSRTAAKGKGRLAVNLTLPMVGRHVDLSPLWNFVLESGDATLSFEEVP